MTELDVRWKQRLENLKRAYNELKEAVQLSQTRPLSKLEKQGLIQSFEYTHELAWKTLKDFFSAQGNTQITGSKDAIREAFKAGLIQNGQEWMDMIVSRNLSFHTYNQKVADQITEKIVNVYFELFSDLIDTLSSRELNV
ncbi:MAG: nucleotidyltransferase [Bdellovibrio sp.]|nr:MAG: nucleotidyltransferase [Bdellovibrio sp.]